MFLGYGGSHFKDGSAQPNVNSAAGVNALNMMKSLSAYMNPDFLTHDSNATNAEFRAGNVAIMNMWGSRAATLVDVDGVSDEVKNGMNIAGPMTVGGGNTPASTLWWDGWTVAKNVSDAEAEATFIAMMNGIDPSIIKDEDIRKQAVWLIDGTPRQMLPAACLQPHRPTQFRIRCCRIWVCCIQPWGRNCLTSCRAKNLQNRHLLM